nr:unnamed protein product [Spirometra erinaceieuropaei]
MSRLQSPPPLTPISSPASTSTSKPRLVRTFVAWIEEEEAAEEEDEEKEEEEEEEEEEERKCQINKAHIS